MNNEEDARPNLWAIRLMENIANNLFLSSAEINDAYRQCIALLVDAEKRKNRALFLVKPGE